MSVAVLAYVGLGSNLEDPERQIDAALDALDHLPGTRLRQRSRLYRTLPWGRRDQPDFVNAAAVLESSMTPRALLDSLQAIERGAGRERIERWGPRILDLDLLLYADACIDEPGLRVPHPHLHERAFVLVPLAEIAPEVRIPRSGARVADLVAAVDCSGVQALG